MLSQKKVIVCIHEDQLCSLTVITDAGLVDHFDEMVETAEIPCILYLDSFSLHLREEISAKLRLWLNAE